MARLQLLNRSNLRRWFLPQPLQQTAQGVLHGGAAHLGAAYWAGFGVALLGLVWEHRLARTLDVGLVNRAFFQINAMVSVALLAGVAIELRVVQNALR